MKYVVLGIQLVGGSYQWSDYTKPQYTNWGSGEPTGSLKSASIRNDTTWTDLGPNEKKYALCKKGKLAITLVNYLNSSDHYVYLSS